MSRKQYRHIGESLSALLALERRHADHPQQAIRVKMLRLMKKNPTWTLAEISEQLGCSERSVSRWLGEYDSHGIDGLVANDDEGRSKINQAELDALRSKLKTGQVGTLNEIQRWLRDRFGVEYSIKAISNLLQHRLKARRIWIVP